MDILIYNKYMAKTTKDNYEKRKELSAIQGHEVQEDCNSYP